MKYRKWGLLAFCLLLTACHTGRKPTGEKTTVISPVETIATTEETQLPVIEKSRIALYLDSARTYKYPKRDSSIAVKLLYATRKTLQENYSTKI